MKKKINEHKFSLQRFCRTLHAHVESCMCYDIELQIAFDNEDDKKNIFKIKSWVFQTIII